MEDMQDDLPLETGDSMLSISMEPVPGHLAGRIRQRIAEVSLSGDIAKEVSKQSSGGAFPEHGSFGAMAAPQLTMEWRQKGETSKAHLILRSELERLGFDPEMMRDSDSRDLIIAKTELVLWLASHSKVRLNSSALLEANHGQFASGSVSLAAVYGPSAVGSLAAILARAAGEPVQSIPGSAGGEPLNIERKVALMGSGPRMPRSHESFWMPSWALGLTDSMLCAQAHPGSCEATLPQGYCREHYRERGLVPAVAADFSHHVLDGSASARARAAVMIRSGALLGL